jgi:hypothetical protein
MSHFIKFVFVAFLSGFLCMTHGAKAGEPILQNTEELILRIGNGGWEQPYPDFLRTCSVSFQ